VGDDDDDDDDDDATTPDTVGSLTACSRAFDGSYGGASSGRFEATVDALQMRVFVRSVSAEDVLDGILDLEADGDMYGESQGYWMDGAIDVADCSMSGDWGIVEAPGVSAGWWEAGD
jgi:hypothetical protein